MDVLQFVVSCRHTSSGLLRQHSARIVLSDHGLDSSPEEILEIVRAEINLALVEAGNHTETAMPPRRKRALVEFPTPQEIKRSRIGV